MACMLLADLGADVVRIDRTEATELGVKRPPKYNLLMRNSRLMALDLKRPEAVAQVLELVEHADVLIEGFRPGVTERLGLGPEACLARNSRLVYGRMTGWGQDGPLSQAAGHDLNYVALTGIIHAIGREGQAPAVPLALTGDMGGGALYLALGVLAALLEVRTSGQGQVIDAAIVDGAASLATIFYGLHAAGIWQDSRGSNVLDSGAPFYDVYECSDGHWISIARSRRASTRSCWRSWSWIQLRSERRTTAPPGRAPRPRLHSASTPGPEPRGASYWKAPMSASLPCCPSPRRRSTRTSKHAGRSWR